MGNCMGKFTRAVKHIFSVLFLIQPSIEDNKENVTGRLAIKPRRKLGRKPGPKPKTQKKEMSATSIFPKRGPGRPRKDSAGKTAEQTKKKDAKKPLPNAGRKRGRPRKSSSPDAAAKPNSQSEMMEVGVSAVGLALDKSKNDATNVKTSNEEKSNKLPGGGTDSNAKKNAGRPNKKLASGKSGRIRKRGRSKKNQLKG